MPVYYQWVMLWHYGQFSLSVVWRMVIRCEAEMDCQYNTPLNSANGQWYMYTCYLHICDSTLHLVAIYDRGSTPTVRAVLDSSCCAEASRWSEVNRLCNFIEVRGSQVPVFSRL